MNNNQRTIFCAVLHLPGRGNFAPVKYGTSFGDFIKTKIPGLVDEKWIFAGRIYKQGEIEEFNTMCEKMIPEATRLNLRPAPMLFEMEIEATSQPTADPAILAPTSTPDLKTPPAASSEQPAPTQAVAPIPPAAPPLRPPSQADQLRAVNKDRLAKKKAAFA